MTHICHFKFCESYIKKKKVEKTGRINSAAAATKSLQSCLTLCDPMDCTLPGSSVHGILQARILEWVLMPSSNGSSQPGNQTRVSYVSCTGRRVLYHLHPLQSPLELILVICFNIPIYSKYYCLNT